MKIILILTCLFVSVCTATQDLTLDGLWNQMSETFNVQSLVNGIVANVDLSEKTSKLWGLFKKEHRKSYGPAEDKLRLDLFKGRVKKILAQNAKQALGKATFTCNLNHLMDKSNEELARLRGYRAPNLHRRKRDLDAPRYKNTMRASSLPKSVNWTAEGCDGPVHNQDPCGSCYAYAAMGTIEDQACILKKKFVPLSTQYLVDCNRNEDEGNWGCQGGYHQEAFEFATQNGVVSEESYPDNNEDQNCTVSSEPIYNLTGWSFIEDGNEVAMQQAVAKIGSISVYIDAGDELFAYYESGIYSQDKWNSINHVVKIVGYGTIGSYTNKQDYWIVKNSWGEGWGQGGYMQLARNKGGMCGISTDAAFPIVKP